MKGLFFCLFLIFLFQVHGQNIYEGEYSLRGIGEFGKETEIANYKILPNNRFEFETYFFKHKYGEGNYIVNDDSLIFEFDNCHSKLPNELNLIESTVSNSDSIEIKIKVELGTLPSEWYFEASYYIYNKIESDKKEIVGGGVVRDDSTVIYLSKQSDNYIIKFVYFKAENTFMYLKGDCNSNYILVLNKSNHGCINGDRYAYFLRKSNEKKIVLEGFDFEGNKYAKVLIKQE